MNANEKKTIIAWLMSGSVEGLERPQFSTLSRLLNPRSRVAGPVTRQGLTPAAKLVIELANTHGWGWTPPVFDHYGINEQYHLMVWACDARNYLLRRRSTL